MSVKQRGNGWEAYVTYKGEKFRRTLSTKEDATVLEAMWQREVAQGKRPTKMEVDKETGKVRKREDGKVLKGENFSETNLKEVLYDK